MATPAVLRRGDVVRTPTGREATVVDYDSAGGSLTLEYTDDEDEVEIATRHVAFVRRPFGEMRMPMRERVLRALKAPSTVAEVSAVTGIPDKNVRAYISVLMREGRVARSRGMPRRAGGPARGPTEKLYRRK